MIKFILNDKIVEINQPKNKIVLDVLRQEFRLMGTKEGCREGDCGACTILVGSLPNKSNPDIKISYKTINSCLLAVAEVENCHVVTIEGLNQEKLTPIQEIFVNKNATQCGFCTPGFIVSLTGFFINSKKLSLEDATDSISGNICRCTGYASILRVVETLCDLYSKDKFEVIKNVNRIENLVKQNILPAYFLDIDQKLIKLLGENKKISDNNTNKEKIFIAGGTDYFIQHPDNNNNKNLVFLSKKEELNKIQIKENICYIGAATTLSEIENSKIIQKILPKLKTYFKLIASHAIRNRATIGGNIANASPIGDLSIIFLALNAKLILVNENKTRTIYLKDFFKGYKDIDLKQNEIIKQICFNIIDNKNFLFNFEKVSKRKYLDIASVNSAIFLKVKEKVIKDIHLSFGGVAPIPLYFTKTCNFLIGKKISSKTLLSAYEKIAKKECLPIDDVRGSKKYKLLLVRQLLFAHFINLFPELDLNLGDIKDIL